MYYHIKVSTNSGHYLTELKTDLSEDQLNVRFLSRFQERKNITINGRSIKFSEIERIQIYQSEENTNDMINDIKLHGAWEFTEDDVLREVAVKGCEEISDDILIYPEEEHSKKTDKKIEPKMPEIPQRIFISHGSSKEWLLIQNHIEKDIKLNTLELAQEPNKGRTVLQKLNEESDKCSYAVVVMTGEDKITDDETRARENVMHEIGFFQGKYGLEKVCLLHEDGTNIPSNIHRLVYIPFPKGVISATFGSLTRELKAYF